jgi:hypothetical protein
MKFLFILNFLFFFISINGQIKISSSFNKAETYTLKKLHRNDTVLILCDTVFLVNRPLFLIYNGLYSKQKNIQIVLNESSELFQNHITDQEKQYDKLNTEFRLTLEQFRKYRDNSNKNLDSLQGNLKGAEESLLKARKENEILKSQIDKGIHQNNSQKYYFGLAGISIGLAIAFLIR